MTSYDNPIFFIIDMFKAFAITLDSYEFWGVSLFLWSVTFIFVGMAISVFWRGARG